MPGLLRSFLFSLAVASLSTLTQAADWRYEPIAEPRVVDGVTIETFRFDSGPVDTMVEKGGGEPIPQPDSNRDVDEHGGFEPVPKALLGYIEGSAPTRLVVMCHGLNGDALGGYDDWRSFVPHVTQLATEDVAVLAVNYRNNFLFPIGLGSHDVIAGTLAARERLAQLATKRAGKSRGREHRSDRVEQTPGAGSPTPAVDPVQTVYLWGISMGGAISGTAISESQYLEPTMTPVFHHWIAVEPLVSYMESYLEANAALPDLAREMENESGGTPDQASDEYRRRTVVLNADRMANTGLRTITIVHAINDGLVPYNQGREMATAAVQAGIPTQFFTVGRKSAEHDQRDYTGTNTLTGGGDGETDEANIFNLAGHAVDYDATHPVTRTSFQQLLKLIDGSYDESTPYLEHFVDDGG